jgi:hypothetical protein
MHHANFDQSPEFDDSSHDRLQWEEVKVAANPPDVERVLQSKEVHKFVHYYGNAVPMAPRSAADSDESTSEGEEEEGQSAVHLSDPYASVPAHDRESTWGLQVGDVDRQDVCIYFIFHCFILLLSRVHMLIHSFVAPRYYPK